MTNLIRYIENNQIIDDVVNKYLTRENDTYKLTEAYDTTLYFSVKDIVNCDKFIREITGCQELDSPRSLYRWMFYGHAFNQEIYIPVTNKVEL